MSEKIISKVKNKGRSMFVNEYLGKSPYIFIKLWFSSIYDLLPYSHHESPIRKYINKMKDMIRNNID